jgi:intracellular septation protein A
MELRYEVWEARAKFMLTAANGLVLASIVSYVLEEKNLVVGVVIIVLGILTMFFGLYLTSEAAYLKRKEK